MFFSPNPATFHKPIQCTLNNGTVIFYGNTNLGCSCLASIRADPDFAGPGLIASFTFICWLTIVVAAVPTMYALWHTWLATPGPKRFSKFVVRAISFEREEPTSSKQSSVRNSVISFRNPNRNDDSDSDRKAEQGDHHSALPASRMPIMRGPEPLWCVFSRRIILQLCDLQIVTGIAILVSALAQVKNLTFYHAQFATQFWWMTLNSFWVSRIDYSRDTPEMRTWRASARRLSIWLSVVLSCAVQALVAYREDKQWDPTIPGHCYVANGAGTGFGQNLFWLIGTGIYLIVLTFSLFKWSRRWFDKQVNQKLEPSLAAMSLWMHGAWRNARSHSKTSIFGKIFAYIRAALYAMAFATWWLTVLFLTIWCAGNSAAFIELVVYSIFAGFLTWWILFLKVQNTVLIRGDETRFTLGQTLPLFLLLLIAIHSLDVWAGVKRDDLRRKARALRGGEEPEEPEGAVESATMAAMAVTRPIEGAIMTPDPEAFGERRLGYGDLEKGEQIRDDLRVSSLRGSTVNGTAGLGIIPEKQRDLT